MEFQKTKNDLTTTTISIEKSQKKYIDSNNIDLSKLSRKLLADYILSQTTKTKNQKQESKK